MFPNINLTTQHAHKAGLTQLNPASFKSKFGIFTLLMFFLVSGAFAVENKPNVLFISVDDLNDWIGCLGANPQTKTPNIDKLASQGTLFTRAYCPVPACMGSRAATLTGIAPYNSGLYENSQQWKEVLLPQTTTLPKHFMNNGYYTAGAGKIFHHYQNDPESWNDYYPSKKYQFPPFATPPKKDRPNFNKFERFDNWYDSFDWGPLDLNVQETGDYKSVKFIQNELNKKHSKPFFLTCGIYRPHLPWYVPRKYFDMFPLNDIQMPDINYNDYDDIPPGASRNGKCIYFKTIEENGYLKQTVQAYLASIAYMDEMIGILLNSLAKSAYADNTIVVFWSDHGWHLGEKLTFRKFTLWEEAARVPLIIRLPKSIKTKQIQGLQCDKTVSLLDLYPTLVSLCGLKPVTSHQLDGHDLIPLLKNPNEKWAYPAITTSGRMDSSVRTEKWTYISNKNGIGELYSRSNDPNEWINLAGLPAYQNIIEEMKKMLPQKYAPMAKTSRPDLAKYVLEAQKELKEKQLVERIFKEDNK